MSVKLGRTNTLKGVVFRPHTHTYIHTRLSHRIRLLQPRKPKDSKDVIFRSRTRIRLSIYPHM